MRIFGSRNFGDSGRRWHLSSRRRHLGLCVLAAAVLALAGCASTNDGDAIPPYQETEANRDLVDGAKDLKEPLVSDTESEGTMFGAFLGSVVSAATDNDSSVGLSIGYGALGGSIAGRYVAAKQEEYSEEIEVIEAITRDVQGKNEHAERTIKAMEVVIAEDRARLDQIRNARADGKISKNQLTEEVAFAERDLETMRRARDSAEEHLKTFAAARSIVIEDSEKDDLEQSPEVTSLDVEIEALRARIKTMHDLVDELSGVT